jgi:two-component system sensor histidine kinase UhpB
VYITVKRNRNSIQLAILDNGKGFDLKRAKRGIDLANIRNRVEAFNGSLNIITAPGAGCSIEITVPLKKSPRNKSSPIIRKQKLQ